MPFCPKCCGEFQEWVKECPDCKLTLVAERPPVPEKSKYDEIKLVTVASYNYPTQAHIAEGNLKSQGIQAVVVDEFHYRDMSIYGGGVKVKVKEKDAERAEEILRFGKSNDTNDTNNEDEEKISCPKCNSTDLQIEDIDFSQKNVFIRWINTLYPLKDLNFKCNDCGYNWKE
jgi:hypothetical protein